MLGYPHPDKVNFSRAVWFKTTKSVKVLPIEPSMYMVILTHNNTQLILQNVYVYVYVLIYRKCDFK